MRLRSRALDLLTAALIAGTILAVVWLLPDSPPERIAGPAFVVDGDSLEILGTTVRLAGLDAPEAGQDCRRTGQAWACGEAASQALKERIGGTQVVCEAIRYDRYRRVLAECFQDKDNLNRWLVEQGWALSTGGYPGAEVAARKAKRGLWSGEFERPADWRRNNPRQ